MTYHTLEDGTTVRQVTMSLAVQETLEVLLASEKARIEMEMDAGCKPFDTLEDSMVTHFPDHVETTTFSRWQDRLEALENELINSD